MRKEERWHYALFVRDLAGGIIMPLVPLFVLVVLDQGVEAITIATVLVLIAQFPAFMLWGYIVDKMKRRKAPIVLGVALSTIGILIMAFSYDLLTLVVGSIIYGFFNAGPVPAASMLVMEHTTKDKWGEALASYTRLEDIGWTSGMAIGVAFVGIMPSFIGTEDSMRWLFLFCAVAATISWILATRLVKEPHAKLDRKHLMDELHKIEIGVITRLRHMGHGHVHHTHPKHVSKARKKDAWHGQLDIYLAATFVIFLAMEIFFTPFPVMLEEELGFTDTQIFLAFFFISAVTVVGYSWAGKFIDKQGNKKAQLIAWGLMIPVFTFTMVSLMLTNSGNPILPIAVMFGAIIVGGIAFTIINIAGTTTASEIAPEEVRGEAVGAFNGMMGVGAIIGGILGGAIAVFLGYYWVNMVSVLISAAALGILLKLKIK
jgi:MFS family permease